MKRTPIKKRLTKGKVCKNCKDPFDQQRFGQVVCGYTCSIPYSKKLEEKKKQDNEKIDRKRVKEEKEKIKTLSQLKQDLQPIVNHIARLIDNGYSCISCGGTGKMSAGHFWSTGSYDHLRFHLENIWNQDFHCNNHKGGAPREYIDSIGKIFGARYKSYIYDDIRRRFNDLRFDRLMITEAIKVARVERNALKRADKTYILGARIEKRREINEKIGIYV